MKKIRILGVTLMALFAFSAIIASMASAETTLLAEWLINGAAVTASTNTEGSGELKLGDAKIGLEMTCSGILVGTVGANGADTVTALLSLTKAATSLASPLTCTPGTGCEAPAQAVAENLPWKTTLFLTEGGLFRDAVSVATYWSMCNILGFLTEEECTDTNSSYEVLNVTGGVEGMGEVTPLGQCTVGGANAGAQTFSAGNLLAPTAGGTLTASE